MVCHPCYRYTYSENIPSINGWVVFKIKVIMISPKGRFAKLVDKIFQEIRLKVNFSWYFNKFTLQSITVGNSS